MLVSTGAEKDALWGRANIRHVGNILSFLPYERDMAHELLVRAVVVMLFETINMARQGYYPVCMYQGRNG